MTLANFGGLFCGLTQTLILYRSEPLITFPSKTEFDGYVHSQLHLDNYWGGALGGPSEFHVFFSLPENRLNYA